MEPFDCELIHSGWPAQPVNAASALIFVVVGLWLWRRQGRRGAASAAAAVGLGSAWFHSSPSEATSWAHDAALYALLAVAAVEVWRRLEARQPPILATVIVGAGLLVWFFSRTGGALCDPNATVQGHAVWHLAAATATFVLFAGPRYERRFA